jgi:hypothetical protein
MCIDGYRYCRNQNRSLIYRNKPINYGH